MPDGEDLKALIINCTLKASPATSNTEAMLSEMDDQVAAAILPSV